MRVLVLPMLLATCAADETISGYADPAAVYVVQSIDGTPFAAQATLSFPSEGRIAGRGPCNSYSGSQTAPYPWFAAGPLRSTKRACADLAQEQAFFAALGRMTLSEVSGPVLILSNDNGGEIVLRAQDQEL